MKKRILSVLLLLMCLPGMFALAESPQPADSTSDTSPPDISAATLPKGIWSLSSDSTWTFITQENVSLDPEQIETAVGYGLPIVDGQLPQGTALSSKILFALYPSTQESLSLPLIKPNLELFSLTGEWFYDDNGMLMYRHDDGYANMTVNEVFASVNGRQPTAASEKVIYLTIDDTPSSYTMDLLAVLNKLGVKATFFVVGAYAARRPVFVRAMYDQGHVIANHSYSHDAITLTTSFDSCLNDFMRCEEAVADALGFRLPMPILRVPYGSSTIPSAYKTQLQEYGYMWIDWNALNGDTEAGMETDQDLLDRAIYTASRYDGSIVMLVHDGKKRTIRTLEAMVEHFHEQGYVFRTLTTDIDPIPGVRIGFPQ